MDEKKPTQNKLYTKEGMKVMGVAFELGFIIALPILALATLGKWLDNKYDKNYLVYIGVVLAIVLTTLWLYRRFTAMIKDLEEAAKTAKNKPNNKKED